VEFGLISKSRLIRHGMVSLPELIGSQRAVLQLSRSLIICSFDGYPSHPDLPRLVATICFNLLLRSISLGLRRNIVWMRLHQLLSRSREQYAERGSWTAHALLAIYVVQCGPAAHLVVFAVLFSTCEY